MINLPTLNYNLAGIQLSTQLDTTRVKWDYICQSLDKSQFDGSHSRQFDYPDLEHIIRHIIRPFGVANGLEVAGRHARRESLASLIS